MAHWRTRSRVLAGVGAVSLLALPAVSYASITGYLKIPDIDGESFANAGVEPDEIDAPKASASAAQIGRGRAKARAKVDAMASTNASASSSGKSSQKDSGEAHLDYLKVALLPTRAKGDDHSAGDEHEIVYDIAAGAAKAQVGSGEGHHQWIPVEGVSFGSQGHA